MRFFCDERVLDSDMHVESAQNYQFWNSAGRYATKSGDEPFANEMAYMMVTLHRTGS